MLIRQHDAPADADDWRSFVQQQGFGHLIASGSGRELPVVVPTQFVLAGDEVLLHLSRSNPLWAALDESPRCMLAVAGDWAYIPGAWKVLDGDGRTGIPTTYYGAVQLEGTAAVAHDPASIAAILREQTAGEGLVDPLEHPGDLRAIRGLRLRIENVRAKFKYGGNLEPEVAEQIVERLLKRKGPGDLAAAQHARKRLPARVIEPLPALPPSWAAALGHPDLGPLEAFLAAEQVEHEVFPPLPEVFTALDRVPFPDVRVVILGQDPYHAPGQAHGLAFSVRSPTRPPPSLKNVFAELEQDRGITPPGHGDLSAWTEQGVLLLNTVLTVRRGKAGSHAKKGWEELTRSMVAALSAQREGLVFVLWGNAAQQLSPLIDAERHRVLCSAHPSPFSAATGFFGSRPFSQVDRWFESRGEPAVDWRIPPDPPTTA